MASSGWCLSLSFRPNTKSDPGRSCTVCRLCKTNLLAKDSQTSKLHRHLRVLHLAGSVKTSSSLAAHDNWSLS